MDDLSFSVDAFRNNGNSGRRFRTLEDQLRRGSTSVFQRQISPQATDRQQRRLKFPQHGYHQRHRAKAVASPSDQYPAPARRLRAAARRSSMA